LNIHKNINLFHESYVAAILQINANKTALNNAGFTFAKISTITSLHDAAYNIQLNRINLKEEITDLSEANQKIINDALAESQIIIDGIKAMAIASQNNDLKKRATRKAILKTVEPTSPCKPRKRKIKPASALIIFTN